jgi:rare lipoprotein A
MSPPAAPSGLHQKLNSRPATRRRVAATVAVSLLFLVGMFWDGIEAATQSDVDSGAVVLSLANADISVAIDVDMSSSNGTDSEPFNRADSCLMETTAALLPLELPADNSGLMSFPNALRARHDLSGVMSVMVANASSNGSKLAPRFATAYRSLMKLVILMGLPRIQDEAALMHATIVGTVSTYNPRRDGNKEDEGQTASGELYDPSGWTAAIQIDLRNQFGGVRYGRFYQPTFALVESGEKRVIVKINDVGPLKPGRVLDLNERSMRHFDPFLTRGLIEDVKITLLPGEYWTPGPIGVAYAIDFASAALQPAPVSSGLVKAGNWQSETELTWPLRRPFPYPSTIEDARAEMQPSTGG